MEHVTYNLKKPIQITGKGAGGSENTETISELKFRNEVVAGDMRGIPVRDPMDYGDLLKIAGRLCGQPDHVINRLSFADMTEVISLVSGFMGSGQETGPTDSAS